MLLPIFGLTPSDRRAYDVQPVAARADPQSDS